MKNNFLFGGLAAAALSTGVAASGSPVIKPRATTTVTPITVTGNGQSG